MKIFLVLPLPYPLDRTPIGSPYLTVANKESSPPFMKRTAKFSKTMPSDAAKKARTCVMKRLSSSTRQNHFILVLKQLFILQQL